MNSQRMCVVCRQMKFKEELIRVVKTPNGAAVDTTFKAQGRGAYICNLGDCIKNARRRRAFERSLSGNVAAELYDSLEALIADAE